VVAESIIQSRQDMSIEISTELKDRVLAGVERNWPAMLALIPTIKSKFDYVKFPIIIDGSVHGIRFNVAENRFDQVEIIVAKDGIMQAEWLSSWTAYCDHVECIVIPILGDFP